MRGLRETEEHLARALVEALVILPLGAVEAWQAGIWRRNRAEQGLTPSQADCLIAAAAAQSGAVLVTGNPKDFPMEEVHVEQWPVGR